MYGIPFYPKHDIHFRIAQRRKHRCTLWSFSFLFLFSSSFLLISKVGEDRLFFPYPSFLILQLSLSGDQQALLYWRIVWAWVMQTWLLDKVENKQIWKIVFQANSLFYCLILFWLSKKWIYLCILIFLP